MRLSFEAILNEHSPILVLDCASSHTHAGLLDCGRAYWSQRDLPAGSALFDAVQEILERAGCSLDSVSAFGFNHGPGSILGIRTAAIAIRTWQAVRMRPCFAYSGLSLLAAHEAILGRPAPFGAIADARRDTWHLAQAEPGVLPTLNRVPPGALKAPLIAPEHFRTWAPLPESTEVVPFDPATLVSGTRHLPLWEATEQPDAFLHEEPAYKTWDPGIHRAPTR